jgi:hypothetical protein
MHESQNCITNERQLYPQSPLKVRQSRKAHPVLVYPSLYVLGELAVPVLLEAPLSLRLPISKLSLYQKCNERKTIMLGMESVW